MPRPSLTRRHADGDVCHECKILDQPDSVALWRLGRANHAPVRVVKLTRSCRFACPVDGGVESPQMRQRRRESKSIQHLADTSTDFVCLGAVTPVASGKGVSHLLLDDLVINGTMDILGTQLATVCTLLKLATNLKYHHKRCRPVHMKRSNVLYEVVEVCAEKVRHQRTRKIESLSVE